MKSKNILIVENKEQERKLFEHLVGQFHPYASLDTGMAALQYISQQPVRLVLLSLQLTDLEPIQILQSVKRIQGQSCSVIAVSSNRDDSQASFFLSQGFDEFITKPVHPKEFIFKIQSLLAKQEEKGFENLTEAESLPILNHEVYYQLLRLSTKEVIDQVYTDFMEECTSLSQVLDLNSMVLPSEEILRAIHTIKGNSGTLGAEKIYAAAKCSESLGRQGKSIDFAESLHYLKATLVEFQEFISKEPNLYGE
jgi:DNA-binding response OmpR family regulator